MRRRSGRNPNENPGVRPVEKIELHEGGLKKKVILAAVLLAIGLALIGYSLFSALGQDAGWTQIEPLSQSAESVASEFMFLYELGASGQSPSAEYKALSRLYTDLCANAYRIFHADRDFDGVNNLHYLNRHIGEEIRVEPALYRALEQIEQAGNRFLFAAPYYVNYKNLFNDTEDGSAKLVDPYESEEVAAYFAELSVYTASEEHIRLELLGNETVKLIVSDAYRTFAAEQQIDTYVDLYWAKNAFVVDYIADELAARGYVYGSLSSFDGFVRALDTRSTSYSYHLYDLYEGTIYQAARLEYSGASSLVMMRSYRMNEHDEIYYHYKNGESRHAYVDVTDGLCKASMDNLVSYSHGSGCAEVLLAMMPVYIAESPDIDALATMAEQGIYSIRFDGMSLCYYDKAAKLHDLYDDGTVRYTPNLIS